MTYRPGSWARGSSFSHCWLSWTKSAVCRAALPREAMNFPNDENSWSMSSCECPVRRCLKEALRTKPQLPDTMSFNLLSRLYNPNKIGAIQTLRFQRNHSRWWMPTTSGEYYFCILWQCYRIVLPAPLRQGLHGALIVTVACNTPVSQPYNLHFLADCALQTIPAQRSRGK